MSISGISVTDAKVIGLDLGSKHLGLESICTIPHIFCSPSEMLWAGSDHPTSVFTFTFYMPYRKHKYNTNECVVIIFAPLSMGMP